MSSVRAAKVTDPLSGCGPLPTPALLVSSAFAAGAPIEDAGVDADSVAAVAAPVLGVNVAIVLTAAVGGGGGLAGVGADAEEDDDDDTAFPEDTGGSDGGSLPSASTPSESCKALSLDSSGLSC